MNRSKPAFAFDFGGVLIDWDPRYLYRKLFDGDADGIEKFFARVGFFEWNINQDRGYPFSEAVAELSSLHPEDEHLIRAYHLRYEEAIRGPIEPTVSILRSLKEAGYPLYALSNWSEEKFCLVRPRYEFFDWFDDIIISGAVKLIKPDPRIFSLLLDKIGRRASECIYIDDSQENVEVAQQLGFIPIHFQSAEQLTEELAEMKIVLSEGD
jgi:2-haloacid dehalogenase